MVFVISTIAAYFLLPALTPWITTEAKMTTDKAPMLAQGKTLSNPFFLDFILAPQAKVGDADTASHKLFLSKRHLAVATSCQNTIK